MSKIKKILALLLAMTMVMGMSMTTFADGKSATIKVNNAEDATLTYVQVIKPDPTTTTGWAFCNPAIAAAYTSAFELAATDSQVVIKAMIDDPSGNAGKIGIALSNVARIGGSTFGSMNNPQTVTSAGVYAIQAVEAGYTYSVMAAYVGFNGTGDYPSLKDVEVSAKKAPTTVIKDNDDKDDVVAIGDKITYTVKARVPYIDPNGTNKTFFIYDKLTGATYDLTGATVKMDTQTLVPAEFPIVLNTDNKGFSIDLSDLINPANSNANKEIVVTYNAVVTAVTAENEAAAGHKGGSQFGSDSTETYTGDITLTKYNEDESAKLAGAGFEVTKDAGTTPLKFVENAVGDYTYSPTGTGTVTEVFTGAGGTLIVRGLDVGTYHFKEKTAPEGYSVNATAVDAILVVEGETATGIISTTAKLSDTKLSALPETGGIGTIIFTIGGCLIMFIAAGLFFAIRRKSVK